MTSPKMSPAVIRRGPARHEDVGEREADDGDDDAEQLEHQRSRPEPHRSSHRSGSSSAAVVAVQRAAPSVSRRRSRTTPRGATGWSRSAKPLGELGELPSAQSTTARRLSGLALIPGRRASRTAPSSDFRDARALAERRQLGDPPPDGGVGAERMRARERATGRRQRAHARGGRSRTCGAGADVTPSGRRSPCRQAMPGPVKQRSRFPVAT